MTGLSTHEKFYSGWKLKLAFYKTLEYISTKGGKIGVGGDYIPFSFYS